MFAGEDGEGVVYWKQSVHYAQNKPLLNILNLNDVQGGEKI